MKLTRLAIPAVLLFALASCGTTTAQTASPSTSSTVAAQVASKNPDATSANKLSCKTSRRNTLSGLDVFTNVAKGIVPISDAADAAKKTQHDLNDNGSYATGEIRTATQNLSDAFGRVRVSVLESDVPGLTAAMKEVVTASGAFNVACTAIGS